jgi:DNA-directed RNA polymerase subunit RPC12/RpoP
VYVHEPAAELPADSLRLLRLAASCPRCGSRPAVRVTQAVVQAMARQQPESRMATYQCQRRRCGAIFDIPARAFQQAS